jgi:hypothetical protein
VHIQCPDTACTRQLQQKCADSCLNTAAGAPVGCATRGVECYHHLPHTTATTNRAGDQAMTGSAMLAAHQAPLISSPAQCPNTQIAWIQSSFWRLQQSFGWQHYVSCTASRLGHNASFMTPRSKVPQQWYNREPVNRYHHCLAHWVPGTLGCQLGEAAEAGIKHQMQPAKR